MKRFLITVLVALCVLTGLYFLLVFSSRQYSEQLSEMRNSPNYIGFRPILDRPQYDGEIRQFQFVFCINSDTNDVAARRVAYYSMSQVDPTAPGINPADRIYQLRFGDEIEIVERVSNPAQGGDSHTYFVVSAKSNHK